MLTRQKRIANFYWLYLSIFFFLSIFLSEASYAVHAASTFGEIENRPASVFRRICLGGSNAGNYCKQNSECPGSSCADRNVFNLTVAVLYNAPAGDINSIQTLLTSASAAIFDSTDGQAELGTITIHNDAISTNQADLVIHPTTNDVWWQANSGHYRTGGFMEVSINYVNDPTNQGNILAHEFSHLVFDMRDEYESRDPGCGPLSGGAECPDSGAGDGTCLMDGNGSEYCWGQGDPTDVTDLTGGNHDPTNVTEQSSCRNNRSCWDQVVWSWPSTFLMPVGPPDPGAGGATPNPPKFVVTKDDVRVVLVLDESGSMSAESPSRMERLRVAANDFISVAENGTELGIVSYSTDAAPANGHASVSVTPLVANRNPWLDAVLSLSPGGWTNIGDGLQKAKDMIMSAGGVTSNTYVVLMTDGINNRPAPQATADADLQSKVDDLLASNIPVYVTCTGGDFGLQSQCAEIASGTNGFNSDSADAAKMPENFIDFHERITGHQSIDSFYGRLPELKELSQKTFFVDKGSESISFAVLWQDANGKGDVYLIDPNGQVHRTRAVPQGRYAKIKQPIPGVWKMRAAAKDGVDTPYVARAYTHNRMNNFIASTRKSNFRPKEEIYLYAIARSQGGVVTNSGESIIAVATLPDGTKRKVKLSDTGRDVYGHGDDMAGDGIYTGVFEQTKLVGAYQFHFKVDLEDWVPGEEAHHRDLSKRSPRFVREVRLSVGVHNPKNKIDIPEDGRVGDPDPHQKETPIKVIDQPKLEIQVPPILQSSQGMLR